MTDGIQVHAFASPTVDGRGRKRYGEGQRDDDVSGRKQHAEGQRGDDVSGRKRHGEGQRGDDGSGPASMNRREGERGRQRKRACTCGVDDDYSGDDFGRDTGGKAKNGAVRRQTDGFDRYNNEDRFGRGDGRAGYNANISVERGQINSDDGSVGSATGSTGALGMNLKKVKDMKSKIITGLADADGSKNSRIIKK